MDAYEDRRTWHADWRWLVLDVAAVIAFVIIGRDTHNEGNAVIDAVGTLLPFAAGLVAGWVATDAVHLPAALRTGIGVALVAGAAGLAIRRVVFQDGTALPFVLVTFAFFLATMIGWRFVLNRLRTRQASAAAGS